jgi:hypothetical protein
MQWIKMLPRTTLLALTLAVACESSTEPRSRYAGVWEATTFTSTEGSVTTDQLAQGASLILVLSASGSVSGVLDMPNDNVNEDMTGTWTLNGSTITFSQSADTFVRDMPFTVQNNNTLVGDATFSGVRVQVTLTRTPPIG